ncbi:MAG: SixA phosphatase family protein [Actinomycetota bacterium]
MPTLHVLRHAKSDRDAPVADHDRPLAPRGLEAAPRIGDALEAAGGTALALSSTARRAAQTTDLVVARLTRPPEVRYEVALYHAGASELLERLRALDEAAPSVLLVGHNPSVASLVATLADDDVTGRVGKFPTAALATFELAGPWSALGPGGAHLTGYVTPRDLD